ncbi:rho GTPase-activating protein 29-like [Sinocyclocheilus anshuiensis]|uniref:rho GTPase-activating protein 29-like n=1 Tax=Sinocyclocheilus anshuiensis TaxID=1608454 RepID=UPI0007BA9BCE|nr:PREDICTED: rho GTPase-activating protein 29-like [Sinocyclocheilus anshuiensis]
MFAAGVLQQSSRGLNQRSLGMARLPNSHFFPLSSGSGSWGLGRLAKSGSLSSVSSGSDSMDMAGADPDYIMQLVNDVRRFADVLLHLKEAFNTKDHQDCLHQVVHERLGELLRVLKSVISKHHSLNSVEILSAAGTLIAKVKGLTLEKPNNACLQVCLCVCLEYNVLVREEESHFTRFHGERLASPCMTMLHLACGQESQKYLHSI